MSSATSTSAAPRWTEPLAILVVNWNTVDLVLRCVESIQKHVQSSFELVIVDNGSTDGSVAALETLAAADSRVRLVRNPRNYGHTHASNQALAASSAEWVVLLNSDVVVAPGVLEALVAYIAEHPDVALAAPVLKEEEGRRQTSFRRFPDLLTVAFCFNRLGRLIDRWLLGYRLKRRYLMSNSVVTSAVPVDQAGGACVAMRRSVISKVGGLFDQRFPLFFNDVDLSRRIWNAGLQIHVLPLVLEHGDGRSVRKMTKQERRWWLRSGLRDYYVKHGTMAQRLAAQALLGRVGSGPAARLLIPPDGD